MATSVEIGKAYVQLIPKAEGFTNEVTNALGGNIGGLGEEAGASLGEGILSSTAAKILAGGAVLAAAVGTIISKTSAIAEAGDAIDKNSQKLGISAQAYQEWGFILQHTGADISALKGSMRTLSNTIVDAGNGSKSANEKLSALGLSVKDLNGLSQEDQLSLVVSRLQGMENGAERASVANDILGRSAQELAPLLNTSAEDTEAMRQSLHDLGGVMDDEAVQASAHFEDALLDMNTAMDGVKRQAFEDFMPSMSTVMEGVALMVSGDSGAGLAKIGSGVAEFAKTMITKGAEIVKNLVEGIVLQLPELVTQGITMVIEFIDTIGEQLPEFVEQGKEIIKKLVKGFIDYLPNLISTLATGLINLIGTIAKNLPKFLKAGIELLGEIGAGIVRAIPGLVSRIPSIFSSVITAIKNIDWLSIGSNIISGIIQGLKNMGGSLVEAGKEVLGGFKDSILSFFGIHSPSRWARDMVGANIMLGITEGMEDNTDLVDGALADITASTSGELAQELAYNNATGIEAINDAENTTLGAILNVLNNISKASEKEYYFSINGREFALATASEMNIALGRLERKENRR